MGRRIMVFGGLNDYGVHQDLNAFDTGTAYISLATLLYGTLF